MWQRFSEDSRRIILNGQGFAMEMGHAWVDSGHLFLGAVKDLDDNSHIAALLKLSGVQLEEARLYARSSVADTSTGSDEPKLTASAKRVIEYAVDEARRAQSGTVEVEHFLIACVRAQKDPHVGEVLRPLGLDTERLRELLREMASGSVRSAENPLNVLDRAGKEAIEAAHDAMRSSFCGRISTAHLLLGLLAIEDNFTVETLRAAGIDLEALKESVRAQIVNDGQIATPQKKFTPASKRALERARAEAKRYESALIRPQHLLLALLPRPASMQEKISFGTPIDDPLEKVWASLPVSEIQRNYEELRALQPDSLAVSGPKPRQTKVLPDRKQDNLIATTFLVLGTTWMIIVAHGRPATTVFWLAGLAGIGVLVGAAVGTCLMLLFSKSARLKNLWVSSFFLYLLGIILGMFLSKL